MHLTDGRGMGTEMREWKNTGGVDAGEDGRQAAVTASDKYSITRIKTGCSF